MDKLTCALMLLCGVCAATPARAEQAIYKCAGKDGGVTFSPQPCGKDAKQVDTSAALRTGTSPNLQGVSDRAALAAVDSKCQSRIVGINNAAATELRGVEREIARLRAELDRSSNNYAGATRDNGIRSQIAAAEDRRSTVEHSQNQDLRDAQHDCDADRAAEIKAQADRDERARLANAPRPSEKSKTAPEEH